MHLPTTNNRKLLFFLGISYVVMLCATIPLLPTHDDWTGTIAPHQGNLLLLLCPRFSYWRPMEGFIGWIGGMWPQTFPVLPHVIVVTAHYLNALMVYKIARLLDLKEKASIIGCLVFLFAPAMLSDVTNPDGMAQNLASLFGLVATFYYIDTDALRQNPLRNIFCWIILLLTATLAKENGILWGAIAPIIMWGREKISIKNVLYTWIVPLILGIVYLIVRGCLPQDNVAIEEDYFDFSIIRTAFNLFKLVANAFLCVDWISLLHAPSRNLLWAAASFIISLPFLFIIVIKGKKKSRLLLALVLAFLVSECMHIATIFSLMHVYAGLALVALIFICLLNSMELSKTVWLSLCLYLCVSFIIDIHTYICAYNSGLIGKKMAEEAIASTPHPVKKVKIIAIEDDYPRLSSYCVIPYDAFGWGAAAQYATVYKWPQIIDDTRIKQTDKRNIPSLAKNAYKQGFDWVWVVEHDSVYSIRP